MRFGISHDGGTPWFAWRPVKLHNGQWAWLESVVAYNYFDSRVPAAASCNPFTHRVFYPVSEAP